jgi:hypothetical protein
MSLIVNGTQVDNIIYNGVSLDKVIYNGVVVWESFYLEDFEISSNGNGTYTITDWKGTLNGEPSTELIIPDDSRLVL